MGKKISAEAKFLEWVDQAPIEVVQSIMSVANARMKARMKSPTTLTKRQKQKWDEAAQTPRSATVTV